MAAGNSKKEAPAGYVKARGQRRAVGGEIPTMVRLGDAGKLLGLSLERMYDFTKDGVMPGLDSGLIPLESAVRGYISFLKDEKRSNSKIVTLSKVQEERALSLRQRREREAGLLIDADSVVDSNMEIFGALRSELNGVAAAATRDMELRETIDQRINEAIARVRDKIEEQIKNITSDA